MERKRLRSEDQEEGPMSKRPKENASRGSLDAVQGASRKRSGSSSASAGAGGRGRGRGRGKRGEWAAEGQQDRVFQDFDAAGGRTPFGHAADKSGNFDDLLARLATRRGDAT